MVQFQCLGLDHLLWLVLNNRGLAYNAEWKNFTVLEEHSLDKGCKILLAGKAIRVCGYQNFLYTQKKKKPHYISKKYSFKFDKKNNIPAQHKQRNQFYQSTTNDKWEFIQFSV